MISTPRSSPPIVCRQAEGIAPPACCQPPLAERTARLEAAQAVAEAMQPTGCPNCGAGFSALVPCFPGSEWSCEGCGNVFEGES